MYHVTFECGSRSFETFEQALECYKAAVEPCLVSNDDFCDYDSNGLTEDERDQL